MWLAIDCMGKIELLQFVFLHQESKKSLATKPIVVLKWLPFFFFFYNIMLRLWNKVLSYTSTIKGDHCAGGWEYVGGGTAGWWWRPEIDNIISILISSLIPKLPSDSPHKKIPIRQQKLCT